MRDVHQTLARIWASLFPADDEQPAKRPVWSAAHPDVIYIYGYIEKFFGITAMDVINALSRIRGDVTVRINSDGGDVFEAVPMAAAFERHRAAGHKVHVAIDGMAASAASFLAQVGDTVSINSAAHMMLHKPLSVAFGNASVLRERAGQLDTVEVSSMLPYYRRSGKGDPEILAILDAETWYTAQQAVDAGFADKVENAPDKAVPVDAVRAAFLAALYQNFSSAAPGAGNINSPRVSGIPTLRLTTKPNTFKPS